MNEIATIERIAVRALPPVQAATIEGWHVPFGRGQVLRMNAVSTFGIVPTDLFETVELVERRYVSRRRAASFRLTPLDEELDDLLFARGYDKGLEVVVMQAPTEGDQHRDVSVVHAVTPRWLTDLQRLGDYSELRVAEIGESMSALGLTHGVFRIEPDAVGLAVVDSGWMGLFDIAVAEDRRRLGIGRKLTGAMMAWGAGMGAANTYLQVTVKNEPALALYSSLGFAEAYRYWYRRRN